MADTVTVTERFCGPPGNGNGGYMCGLVAARVGNPASVRLAAPIPINRAMELRREQDGAWTAILGSRSIARAVPVELDLAVPTPPTGEETREAMKRYIGFTSHPFPTCFVCGPEREPGDGLRIFASRVGDRELVASAWTPDASLAGSDGLVASEFVWAALDCPGGFAAMLDGPRTVVLGELAVRVDERPRLGEPCVTMGWPLRIDGRKSLVGTALVSESGTVYAQGRATWIEISTAE